VPPPETSQHLVRMTPPLLDGRGFQDLVDEAKRRIPQYCPEWTDHNVADPGVMLIELFAWMTDLLLYRVNQVPDRDFLQFLSLIGARPRPAVPARTELAFWLTTATTSARVIPRGIEIATRQTETRPSLIFTTDADLHLVVPHLRYLWLARRLTEDGVPRDLGEDMSGLLDGHIQRRVETFQATPREGDAFYLGFADSGGFPDTLAAQIVRLRIQCEAMAGSAINQEDPPINWEFWDGTSWLSLQPRPDVLTLLQAREPDCLQLGPRLDNTRGLNRDGEVVLVIPRTSTVAEPRIGADTLPRATWLRCRAARVRTGDTKELFYDHSPALRGIQAEGLGGMVDAMHATEIVGEVLGRSDGTPSQTFDLLHPPILPRLGELPKTVEVSRPDGTFDRWTEVASFGDSAPTDPHFTLDELTGEVRFGPRLRHASGEERQYGLVPPRGHLIRFTRYGTGGGLGGNVPRGALQVPKSAADLSYVKWVTNLLPATGGQNAESLEAYKLRGPQLVRSREVAVTRADFEHHARAASPQIARVRCVTARPTAAADVVHAGPGYVRLLLVPAVATTDEHVRAGDLELPAGLRQQVGTYLAERCPVGIEVVPSTPEYRRVRVVARLVTRAEPEGPSVDQERKLAAVRDDAQRRLFRFIHPVTGWSTGDGWPFGQTLTPGDVYPLLQAVPGVLYVSVVRFQEVDAQGKDLGLEQPLLRLAETEILCSAADHDVVVEAE